MDRRKYVELESQMIEMYKSGMSSISISNNLGVSKRTVLSYLRKNGIEMKTMKDKLNEKRPKIIELFQEGKTVDFICKACNSKHGQVKAVLEEEGFTTPSRKKYQYDENIFETIDTEEKAYWLGFIYADGNVNDNNKGYLSRLTIGIKDKEHILKFIEFIGSDETMMTERNGYYFVVVNSKKMCLDLYNKGVVPRKSLIAEFPSENIIPKNLIRHFIRGYFDGDGSISIRKRTYHKSTNINYVVSLSVVGTPMLVDHIQEHFINELDVSKVKAYHRSPNTHEYSKQGKQSIRILKYLYNESSISLDRKRDKMLSALLLGD
jgi:intein-encoded DNA endonuclease-like protein